MADETKTKKDGEDVGEGSEGKVAIAARAGVEALNALGAAPLSVAERFAVLATVYGALLGASLAVAASDIDDADPLQLRRELLDLTGRLMREAEDETLSLAHMLRKAKGAGAGPPAGDAERPAPGIPAGAFFVEGPKTSQ